MDRTLNQSNIPDALLAEYGLVRVARWRGGAVGTSYPCDDWSAVLMPLCRSLQLIVPPLEKFVNDLLDPVRR